MSFWDSVKSAVNPLNQIKMVYNVAKNPFNPFAQTRAMVNLFRPGGGSAPAPGAGPPPGMRVMPPYPPAPPTMPPGAGWGAPMAPPPGGPMGPTPGWGGAPGPSTPGFGGQSFDNPMSLYGQQGQYDFDPSMYMPPPSYGDSPTGWDASYGGSQGPGW